MIMKLTPSAGHWTESESAKLQRILKAGRGLNAAAEALRRSKSEVARRAFELELSTAINLDAGSTKLLQPGDCFELSEVGKKCMPMTKTPTGVIIHLKGGSSSYIVQFDGRKCKVTIHHSYIQKLGKPKRPK